MEQNTLVLVLLARAVCQEPTSDFSEPRFCLDLTHALDFLRRGDYAQESMDVALPVNGARGMEPPLETSRTAAANTTRAGFDPTSRPSSHAKPYEDRRPIRVHHRTAP